MDYEVLISEALPRPIAAVRATVKLTELPKQIGGILGEVWTFLRDNKIKSTGHNVALYLSTSGSGAERSVDAWFGVEVHEAIPTSGRVVAITTPAGRVASTVHWGDYAGIPEAHTAVRDWCEANGHRITGTDWEVYGDWSDDWAKVRTDIFYLLDS